MNLSTLFGLCAAALVGVGLYGFIVLPHPLRKIIAFNIIGSGVFILFGVVAQRGAVPGLGLGGDPVPQALLITAIVVAFAATALAVALVVRLIEATGSATLDDDAAAPGSPT